MTLDRHLFTEDPMDLPVYEGRMIDAFDHRAKAYRSGRGRAAEWEELTWSNRRIAPQWRIARGRLPDKLSGLVDSYRIGYCSIGSPTNERTLMAALVPPGVVCGNAVPTIRFSEGFEWAFMLWIAFANSLVMDFHLRKKVGLNITHTIVDSLPFPRLRSDDVRARTIVALAARLTCVSEEMRGYWNILASDSWVPAVADTAPLPGIVGDEDRQDARNRLDAMIAFNIFGLSSLDLAHVLDGFPILERRDVERYGEYRTKRAILELYDAMAEAARTGQPYQTGLELPPADPRVPHPYTRRKGTSRDG
jgi:hypothetical protein